MQITPTPVDNGELGSPPDEPVRVLFRAPLLNWTGYAVESRGFLFEALRAGMTIKTESIHDEVDGALSQDQRRQVMELSKLPLDESGAVLWQNTTADNFQRDYRFKRLVGRTMFETDRLPRGWADACNAMDEIWVPSRFNVDTFERAGVDRAKLRVVPAGVDTEAYRPGALPLHIPQRRGFTFLSVFEWIHRKGWDVLLRSFASRFHKDDDVCLIIKTSTTYSAAADPIGEMLAVLEGDMQKRLEDLPPIILLDGYLAAAELSRLYASADAFVLPTRGEGYGRPFMEAMACGLPTIGTRWSGQLDFMNDKNSYLIDVEALVPVRPLMQYPIYAGHHWAEPSAEHLSEVMGRVVADPVQAAKRGAAARREMVERWDWRVVGQNFADELRRAVDH